MRVYRAAFRATTTRDGAARAFSVKKESRTALSGQNWRHFLTEHFY
jgi:hypothetical protein